MTEHVMFTMYDISYVEGSHGEHMSRAGFSNEIFKNWNSLAFCKENLILEYAQTCIYTDIYIGIGC